MKLARKLVVAGAALAACFALIALTPLAYFIGRPLLERVEPRPSDVIVLLSSGQLSRQWLTPDASQRTLGALLLYRKGFAPVIVSSGSHLAEGLDQAGLQAEWLRLAGVPESAILIEDRSTRTYESAREVAGIMRQRGWRTAVVVTSQLDVPRVRLVFRKMGVPVSFLAVPEFSPPRGPLFLSTGYPFLYHSMYEYAALVVYRARGWI